VSGDEKYEDFKKEVRVKAKKSGYKLNPDTEFLELLFQGLFKNQSRYSYPSCPCRLAEGDFKVDADIICPCLYRDPDLLEFGRCYCALYVSDDYTVDMGAGSIPERRPDKRAIFSKVGDRMGVKNVGEQYRCNICSNEVTATKAGGGVLVCCGEEMELLG